MKDTQNSAAVEREGPFHVSRSSDGTTECFVAYDPAACVRVPARDRDGAYGLVASLNRACRTFAALSPHDEVAKLREALFYSQAVLEQIDRTNATNFGEVRKRIIANRTALGETK